MKKKFRRSIGALFGFAILAGLSWNVFVPMVRADQEPFPLDDGTPSSASSRSGNQVGLGPAFMTNLDSSGIGYGLRLGHGWDVDSAVVTLGADLAIQQSALFFSGGVGTQFFFGRGNFNPYVGGDFGLGWAKVRGVDIWDGDSAGGFVLGAGGGIEFLRTDVINLDLGLRWGMLLNATDLGIPMVWTIRVGLLF